MEPELSLLALSLVALALAPLLHALGSSHRSFRKVLHVAVVAAVAGLVLLHVLPECVEHCGAWALASAGVGLTLPLLFEHGPMKEKLSGSWLIGLAVVGIGLHAFADGAAIVLADAHGHGGHGHEHHHEHAMGLAVVLHRLPVAMGIWALLHRHPMRAAGALGFIGFATVVGFGVGHHAAPLISAPIMALTQAFIGGLLLHVFAHGPKAPRVPRLGEV